MRELNYRCLPLKISIGKLKNLLTDVIDLLDFEESSLAELRSLLDFDYALNKFLNTYGDYVSEDSSFLFYDASYTSKLDDLIALEERKSDKLLISQISHLLTHDSTLRSYVDITIPLNLYDYLLNIESEIEKQYRNLSYLAIQGKEHQKSYREVQNIIRKLTLKKRIIYLNIERYLSKYTYIDLINYIDKKLSKEDKSDFTFILEDINFDESDILEDAIKRHLFINSETSETNLKKRFQIKAFGEDENIKHSQIKFYDTFLHLLDQEIIKNSPKVYTEELITIKYKIMNAIDSIYDRALFLAEKEVTEEVSFEEDYTFMQYEIYYLTTELLNYDDSAYVNSNYHSQNIILYTNNVIKKLLIETYYLLTGDEEIVSYIKGHKLYNVNTISSKLLRKMVKESKNNSL